MLFNTNPCPLHPHKLLNKCCLSPNCQQCSSLCQICCQQKHQDHNIVKLQQIYKVYNRLVQDSQNKVRNSQLGKQNRKGSQKISKQNTMFQQTISKLNNQASHIIDLGSKFQLISNKLRCMLYALDSYVNCNGSQYVPNSKEESQDVVRMGKFLSNQKLANEEDFCLVLNKIRNKIDNSVQELKDGMQKIFTVFHQQIQACEVKNWHKFLTENPPQPPKSRPQKHPRNPQPPKPPNTSLSHLDNPLISQSFNQQIQKMFDDIFEVEYKKQQQQTQLSSVVNESISNKTSKKQKYIRYILSLPDTAKIIKKHQIMQTISNLSFDINYSQNLREFVIEGANQFDFQCLRKLAKCFSKLRKFNFVWNFEQAGLDLQKQQCFFEKPRNLDKTLNNFQMNQQLLNLYGTFENLQNIHISQLHLFASSSMTIQNKKIRHLTLGQYIQSGQAQSIPLSIKQQALAMEKLITLNIFNIKKVDGQFMNKIITQNIDTLRKIWISQCEDINDSSLFAVFKISKFDTINFDQLKNIKHPFYVSNTLQTLIFDNCSFACQYPFVGLNQAAQLKNLSIFDSVFPQSSFIGDRLIRQISEINYPQIEYLSVAQCKTVTSNCLVYLQKLTRLKDLCIDNTSICLYKLMNQTNLLRRLRKLGIVGLKAKIYQLPNNMDQALVALVKKQPDFHIAQTIEKCINLKVVSLKFSETFANFAPQKFKKVEHISITALAFTKQFKKRSLRVFVQTLKSMGKTINIV